MEISRAFFGNRWANNDAYTRFDLTVTIEAQ